MKNETVTIYVKYASLEISKGNLGELIERLDDMFDEIEWEVKYSKVGTKEDEEKNDK